MGVPKYAGTVYDSQETFRRWKVNVDDFLYTHDLFGFADGPETAPEKPSLSKRTTPYMATDLPSRATPPTEGETPSTPISSIEDLTTYKAEVQAWEKTAKKFKENRYVTMMNPRPSVTDTRQDTLLHLNDPEKIYDTLVASGIDPNTQTLMQLMRAVYSVHNNTANKQPMVANPAADTTTASTTAAPASTAPVPTGNHANTSAV